MFISADIDLSRDPAGLLARAFTIGIQSEEEEEYMLHVLSEAEKRFPFIRVTPASGQTALKKDAP